MFENVQKFPSSPEEAERLRKLYSKNLIDKDFTNTGQINQNQGFNFGFNNKDDKKNEEKLQNEKEPKKVENLKENQEKTSFGLQQDNQQQQLQQQQKGNFGFGFGQANFQQKNQQELNLGQNNNQGFGFGQNNNKGFGFGQNQQNNQNVTNNQGFGFGQFNNDNQQKFNKDIQFGNFRQNQNEQIEVESQNEIQDQKDQQGGFQFVKKTLDNAEQFGKVAKQISANQNQNGQVTNAFQQIFIQQLGILENSIQTLKQLVPFLSFNGNNNDYNSALDIKNQTKENHLFNNQNKCDPNIEECITWKNLFADGKDYKYPQIKQEYSQNLVQQQKQIQTSVYFDNQSYNNIPLLYYQEEQSYKCLMERLFNQFVELNKYNNKGFTFQQLVDGKIELELEYNGEKIKNLDEEIEVKGEDKVKIIIKNK